MIPEPLPITGTFIDEITYDIPSQNWGAAEWRADFDAMQAIGIDTVIIVRGGLRRATVFPSRAIGTTTCFDLARLFLDEASRRGMRLFFGTYDSWDWTMSGKWREEIDINRAFMDEVWGRYGEHPAFGGWYLTHETSHRRFHFREIYREISEYAKKITPRLPVLISPFYPSQKVYAQEGLEPEEFADNWRHMLDGVTTIDYAAFQDGTAPLDRLEAYLAQAKMVMSELGIQLWNNVETFTRDMPIKFPPIDFRELQQKLVVASSFATKNITFEFSHFMSPNSCYPAARHLYQRYREYITRERSGS
jgi:hypothetical protein